MDINAVMEGPVPSGKCMYEVPERGTGATCNAHNNKHAKLRWDAFVSQLNHTKYSKQASTNKVCGHGASSTKKVRLPIFKSFLKTEDDGKARLRVFKRLTAGEGEVGDASHSADIVPVLSSKVFGPIGPFYEMGCADSQVKK
jgi:hypothetical protein